MKVLVATEATQGAREDDYSWATPGELVMFGAVCATDLRGTGEPCGCGRAFAGLHSERATTTAEVVDSRLTLDDLVLAFRDSLDRGGWPDVGSSSQEVADVVHEALMEVLLVADRYPVGTVIGTRLGVQYVRQEAAAR